MIDFKPHIRQALIDLKVSGESLRDNLDKILMEKFGNIDNISEDIEQALENELGIQYQDINEYTPPADVLRTIPGITALKYTVVPLELTGSKLKVAVVDPTDMNLLMDLRMVSGYRISPVVSDRGTIEEMIKIYYKNVDVQRIDSSSVFAVAEHGSRDKKKVPAGSTLFETPIIRLVNEIISDAIHQNASDIHFEPFEREMKVRLRQDGILHIHKTINSQSMPEVISRLKIMASMDIAEKRRPQDGRISMEGSEKSVDIRMSTLPTEYGEKVVLRILDKDSLELDLKTIGMDKKGLEKFSQVITKPFGMILVTGPTGSGKTTTLYSALNTIKSPELNISTIEDPIEFKMDGINQTAIKPDINLTFASALRTILRQDPNIIMVGEIRDGETAQMAIRSALTGHLVFSTLHTNDAPSAVSRLIDMEMEPFLISSAVSLIMAQRLVRRVCSECSENVTTDEGILRSLGLDNTSEIFKKGKGCRHCMGTGYRGRIGLFETMPITENIRELINNKSDAAKIKQTAIAEGMMTLRQDGINKAKAGITTPEEVLRETNL